MGIKWKKTERAVIRTQLEAGMHWKDAVVPGKTTDGIRRHVRRYNLAPKQRNPALTKAQKTKLRQLKAQGFSAREISDFDMLGFPHRTSSAVQKYVSALRLVNKNKSRARKNRKEWINGEKEAFDNFLRRRSKKLAPVEIAEIFGVVAETVTVRQKNLGVRPSRAESRAMPYFKKKTGEANRVRSRKMLLEFGKHVADKEKQLEELAQKLRRKKWLVPLREKRCPGCGKTWPKRREFFFHAVYKGISGTSWYFTRYCVVCIAKKKHRKKISIYEKRYSQRLE